MDELASNTSPSVPLAAVLELVAMQLEVAMQNAASQAERLSGSVAAFTTIGTRMRAAGDPTLVRYAREIEEEAERAMIAMQFHDQLAQRVTHVRDALGDLHDELLGGEPPAWNELVAKMRAHYTMEDERRLFDLVMWAFPDAVRKRDEEALTSSVELF
jgi:signal transduction histidine kinase